MEKFKIFVQTNALSELDKEHTIHIMLIFLANENIDICYFHSSLKIKMIIREN